MHLVLKWKLENTVSYAVLEDWVYFKNSIFSSVPPNSSENVLRLFHAVSFEKIKPCRRRQCPHSRGFIPRTFFQALPRIFSLLPTGKTDCYLTWVSESWSRKGKLIIVAEFLFLFVLKFSIFCWKKWLKSWIFFMLSMVYILNDQKLAVKSISLILDSRKKFSTAQNFHWNHLRINSRGLPPGWSSFSGCKEREHSKNPPPPWIKSAFFIGDNRFTG